MNWIEARFACSGERTWMLLKKRLLSDLEEFKKLFPNRQIKVEENTPELFALSENQVLSLGHMRSLVLENKQNEFILRRASHAGPHELRFQPFLNTRGECVLVFEENQLEIWQVSRLVLEPLLFGDVAPA